MELELRDFISQTILEIANGVNDAIRKAEEDACDVIVNPDVTIGSDGDYYIPVNDGKKYPIQRRIQNIELDVSITLLEGEEKEVSGGAGINKIVKIGVDASTTGTSQKSSTNKIKFTIPVALPVSKTGVEKQTKGSRGLHMI